MRLSMTLVVILFAKVAFCADFAAGKHVLVVYNQSAPDADGNGKSDDLDAAEYYAARRGVPADNMLGLKLEKVKRHPDYVYFFENILTPVRAKLHSKGANGRPLGESIRYILLAPRMPMRMNTNQGKAEHPVRKGFGGAGRRSVDQWLISIEANFAGGIEKETGRPGRLKNIKLGQVIVGSKLLGQLKYGKLNIGSIKVAGRPMVALPVEKEGKLGEMLVGGRKLGEYPVGKEKLGELNIGTKDKPLKLGEVDVRVPTLGSRRSDISLPLMGRFMRGGDGFAELRAKTASLKGCYLVTRLGKDPASAQRCVDGALYAERYLRGGGAGGVAGTGSSESAEGALPEPAIWLDQKFRFAGDQVASQVRCSALVHPWKSGLFRPGAAGPLAPWKLVIDNQLTEIGLRAKGAEKAHKPTATAKVSQVLAGNVVVLEKKKIGRRPAPTSAYFSPGWEIRRKAAKAGAADKRPEFKAVVRAVDPGANQLMLSTNAGLQKGDELISVWSGEYPTRDCFFFFGFYGLGRFEDVFAFQPGAIGIHVDSSCMRWATGALGRGIAGTYGVVNEPFSAGIPYGDQVLAALVRGRDLAEAMSAAIRFPQRWAGVTFGDPIYAPFRGAKVPDRGAPVLEKVAAVAARGGVRVTALLGGKTPDELADVALFRVEYGPDAKYGEASDFYSWPDPQNPGKVKERNYSGYSRHFSRLLTGLQKGKTYHYRVVALDPAGNRTVSPDATFTW